MFDYLQKILEVSGRTPNLQINIDEYKILIEILLSNTDPKAKSKELQKIKANCIEMLTTKYIKSLDATKIESNFLLLLFYCRRNPEIFVSGIIEAIKLFTYECLGIWKMNFESFKRPSIFIFRYLGEKFYCTIKVP